MVEFTEDEINNLNNQKNKKRPVLMFNLDGKLLNEYKSIAEASRDNDLNPRKICHYCKNNNKSYKNYKFKYKDEIK